jgi:hypothetical protein
MIAILMLFIFITAGTGMYSQYIKLKLHQRGVIINIIKFVSFKTLNNAIKNEQNRPYKDKLIRLKRVHTINVVLFYVTVFLVIAFLFAGNV